MSKREHEHPAVPRSDERVRFVPSVKHYVDTYGKAFEGNDQKGAKLFREYETQEKLKRLRHELELVKNGQVEKAACENIIGKKRASKHRTYQEWARLMLLWLANK